MSKKHNIISGFDQVNSPEKLNDVFDLILTSSKQILGNILSIGIKYGKNLDKPDHMLVLFPNEVYGFESWNGQKKVRWQYVIKTKLLLRNGLTVKNSERQLFTDLVWQGLNAINAQNVAFSKNITKNELKSLK